MSRDNQLELGAAIRQDMETQGMALTALAKEVAVPPATLRTYLDAISAWPIGVLRDVDYALGRNFDRDLVRLGYLSSWLTQEYLARGDEVERVKRAVALRDSVGLNDSREVLRRSPGAELVALLLAPPAAQLGEPAFGQGVRVIPLLRGSRTPRLHSDLVIVPGRAGESRAEHKARLLDTPVQPWHRHASATVGDALDYVGAFVDDDTTYLAELGALYGFSPTTDVAIIAPRLLATRFPDPVASRKHPDATLLVTSLHFGGAADVAALIAAERGFGFASVTRLARQGRDVDVSAYTPYGGLDPDPGSPEARTYHRYAEDLSQLLLDPSLSGTRRCWALDEPLDAHRALIEWHTNKRQAQGSSSVAMLVMSEARVRWTAEQRARGADDADTDAGSATTNTVESDHQALLQLQNDLRQAVEQLDDRPTHVFEVPDPEDIDYASAAQATANPDFDSFVAVAADVRAWLAETGT